MPLPPYITHRLEDKNRYQTVYAKHEGSAAAPTAGLHFTKELLERIQEKGIEIARVTLHVGLGTFRPVKTENILEHHMHSEFYTVTQEAADKINTARKNGGKIIAVGTTSTRTLESVGTEDGTVKAGSGWTQIFIYPGYQFKVIDSLITNFGAQKRRKDYCSRYDKYTYTGICRDRRWYSKSRQRLDPDIYLSGISV